MRESTLWAHIWMALYRPRTIWNARIRIHAPLANTRAREALDVEADRNE